MFSCFQLQILLSWQVKAKKLTTSQLEVFTSRRVSACAWAGFVWMSPETISSWRHLENVQFQFCHRLQLTILAIHLLLSLLSANLLSSEFGADGWCAEGLIVHEQGGMMQRLRRIEKPQLQWVSPWHVETHYTRDDTLMQKGRTLSHQMAAGSCCYALLLWTPFHTFHTVYSWKKLRNSCQGKRKTIPQLRPQLLSLLGLVLSRCADFKEWTFNWRRLRCKSLGPMPVYLGILGFSLSTFTSSRSFSLGLGQWESAEIAETQGGKLVFLLTSVIRSTHGGTCVELPLKRCQIQTPLLPAAPVWAFLFSISKILPFFSFLSFFSFFCWFCLFSALCCLASSAHTSAVSPSCTLRHIQTKSISAPKRSNSSSSSSSQSSSSRRMRLKRWKVQVRKLHWEYGPCYAALWSCGTTWCSNTLERSRKDCSCEGLKKLNLLHITQWRWKDWNDRNCEDRHEEPEVPRISIPMQIGVLKRAAMGFHHPVCMDTSWFTLVSCFFGFSLKSLDTHGCTKSGSRLQKCIQDVFNAFHCGADPFFGAFTFSIFWLCFWSLCLRLWRSKRTFRGWEGSLARKTQGQTCQRTFSTFSLEIFSLALRFVLWPEKSKNCKI